MTKREFEKLLNRNAMQSQGKSDDEKSPQASAQQDPIHAASLIRLPQSASDTEIRVAIRSWIDLLAADRYEEAHAQLLRFPDDEWTPDMMRTVVRHYGFIEPRADGQTYRVTPRGEAVQKQSSAPNEDIEWFEDASGVAHVDLPLNGEWSDVTVIIDIVNHGDGRALRLNDIHVL
ncbi:MAG: hypothetical protein ACK4UN_15650 [Limisphaerales bacterium]